MIQIAIEHLKQCVDQQRKLQGELQLQLKKLDEKTHRDYNEMLREITEKAGQLTNVYKNENEKQNKEF
jgi:phosphate uptake regulator